jgi:N6-L-threonylcarbamoyladenine synthase
VGIAGGVSANAGLRREVAARGAALEIPVFIPRLSLSTDNAAMIGAAGLRQLARGNFAPLDLNAAAALAL